jgi:hypothetical protein
LDILYTAHIHYRTFNYEYPLSSTSLRGGNDVGLSEPKKLNHKEMGERSEAIIIEH